MMLRRLVVAVLAAAGLAQAEPVARWDFASEDASVLKPSGAVQGDQAGPRPPEFPDFPPGNTAVRFDGDGARYVIDDPGEGSRFDFGNGDSITLEAWVNVKELPTGQNRYVIGKGRTHREGFSQTNQNWALRLREIDGLAHVSFLFATDPADGGSPWHRWNSSDGFHPATGWHHIAVSYTFGKPDSAVGWIDGKSFNGSWDMAGPTSDPPVVDDDQVWVASSMGGNPGSSFRGLIDEVAVHRRVVGAAEMAARFHRVGKPRVPPGGVQEMPDLGELPAGEVTLVLSEGLASHSKWPGAGEGGGREVIRTAIPDFYLHRLPFRYDDWGIRDSWQAPVLATLAADLQLAPGERRVIVRTRGLSRLWVNGERVLQTKPHSGSSDGHGPVLPLPEPPAPGLSVVAYGDREHSALVSVPADGRCRVVLEAVIGGKKLRAEPGEMCVAIESEDGGSYRLLSPRGSSVEITAAAMASVRKESERRLERLDAETRRAAASSQDGFWERRHAYARTHLGKQPFSHQSVDGFLQAKIDAAIGAARGEDPVQAEHFHREVLPVLRENCFRCHGEKAKGGLRLNSREAAMLAGKSGEPAIVPGDVGASELVRRITTGDEDERMPPKGEALPAGQRAALEAWIDGGAAWPAPPVPQHITVQVPAVGDAAFLRRAYLDCVGIPPSEAEVREFLADRSADKRARWIDRLLDDPRFADHWVSYWQDVLAENPNMLKPSLNNSGPFRWFLHEALRDNQPVDRLVSELIMLRGSEREGGSAGFGYAADNDSPFAAKGHVIGNAFLGIEMQCARCHDSPYHSTTQRDLYSLAAMLSRKDQSVPKSSTVPASFFEQKGGGESVVKVTLKPGEPVKPQWPFADETGIGDSMEIDALATDPKDPRARLAALITAPQNTRFARVIANRLWKQLIGTGIVEPLHDWEGQSASHPELLDWLAAQLVEHSYDQKHLLRLIMNSDLYAREAVGQNADTSPADRFFAAPDRRRMRAEQVVDSLYAASGHEMAVEELTFDPDGRRPAKTMISLGHPRRAWEFTSLSNERDRPSLALPRAQAVSDVLEAFGWSGSRQGPVNQREADPNVLQPGVLANSTFSSWITRASDGSQLADLAVAAETPGALVDALFLRFLSRFPDGDERAVATETLADGFTSRLLSPGEIVPVSPAEPLRRVSWTNHLHADANRLKLVMEQRAREGSPPDPRLLPSWRERYEDLVWSLVNHPQFIWIP